MMMIKGKLNGNQRAAMQFFADNLLSKQLQRYILVHVVLTKHIENFGEIEVTDYNSKDVPRCFKLYVKKDIGDDEILKTLAHEMVHVKQYCKRELNEEMTKWQGKPYDIRNVDYFDRPWEIEAHTLGDNLVEQYEF